MKLGFSNKVQPFQNRLDGQEYPFSFFALSGSN